MRRFRISVIARFYSLAASVLMVSTLTGCMEAPQAASSASKTDSEKTTVSNESGEKAEANTDEKGIRRNDGDKNQKGDVIFTHSTKKGKLYHHDHYSFSYSEPDEQSEWVGYELTREETYGKQDRFNCFDEDPIVVTTSAHPYEYRSSGYTKGHLAPAADMKFNATAMQECFYMSNMSPQTKEFNSGIWNNLELQVRFWAQKFSTVYVVTGPVLLQEGLPKMKYTNNRGKEEQSDITIPKYFYKIVYDFSMEGKEKMIGFVMSQEDTGNIFDYAVTVDEIEKLTGIDFFHNLSKAKQAELESQINLPAWKKFTYTNKYQK